MTTFPTLTAAPSPDTATGGAVTSARVDWAPVPKVNLLPAEILQGRRLARLKRVLAAGAALTVVACAAGTVWAQSGVTTAQEELDAVKARGALLSAQQARYAAVPKLLEVIRSAGTARERALGRDVLWYGFLTDLAATTPEGITLTGLQVSLDKAPAAQDPLVAPGIGSVTFTGTAKHFPDVAAWLEAVARVHGLDGASLQSAVRGDGAQGAAAGAAPGSVNFTATVTVTAKALTHRYDRKAD